MGAARDEDLRTRLRLAFGAAQAAQQRYLAAPSRSALKELIRAWESVLQPPVGGLLKAEHRAVAAGNLGTAWWWSYQQDRRGEDLDLAIRRTEEALHCAESGTAEPGPGGADRELWLGYLGALSQCLREKAILAQDRTYADRAVDLLDAALTALSPDDDDWAEYAAHLALALGVRYDLGREVQDLRRAAGLRRAIALHPGIDDVQVARGELASYLLELDQAGDGESLGEAIEVLGRIPLDGLADGTAAEISFSLGVALARRFGRKGDPRDAREAVAAFGRAVGLDDRKAKFRDGLGTALRDLWRVNNDVSLLDTAIEEFHSALRRASAQADEARAWHGLGSVLISRFKHTGDVTDLNDALGRLREAVAGAPDDPRFEITLAAGLLEAYELGGEAGDLTEAQRLLEDAAGRCAAGSAEFRASQTTLGNALRRRFARYGDPADLDRAVECHRAAIDRIDDAAPDAPIHLTMYGHALRERYLRDGDPRDLDSARHAYAQAERAAVTEARDGVLAARGVLLLDTYQRTGEIEQLEAAIAALSQAADLCGPGCPALPAYLSDLAAAHKLRYLHTGQLADLEQAIVVLDEAVTRAPATAPDHAAYLANRGLLWLSQFDRTGNLGAVENGVANLAAAVAASPERAPQRVMYQASLGNALLGRYELAEVSTKIEADPGDLDNALALLRSAVALTPAEAPIRSWYLGVLGRVLLVRSERDGRESDLNEAVSLLEQAERRADKGMPERAQLLAWLAYALRRRWQHRPTTDDLRHAVQCYEAACQAGAAAGTGASAATAGDWAWWALNRESWDEAVRAYRWCIEGIGHLVTGHQTRHHKEVWLFEMAQVPSRAAYASARAGDPSAAAATFERTRALLLQEATDARRALLADHPDLHARYRAAMAAIDATAAAAARAVEGGRVSGFLARQLDRQRQDLDRIVAEIAAVTGWTPGRVDTRAPQPRGIDGAWLVQLAAGPRSGIALVHPAGVATVIPVPLDEVAEPILEQQLASFVSSYRRRRTALPDWQKAIDNVTAWLGRAVLRPLLEILPADADVALIAGGLLGLLPVHAAWIPDPAGTGERLYLSGRVRLRHAATVASLRESADAARRARHGSALLIDDPRPGSKPVGASRVDRGILAALFDPCAVLAGDAATPQAVLDAIGAAEHGIIHLSCHAEAAQEHPLDTGFLLAGESKLSARDLSGASHLPIRLAVLAGCETGVVGSGLPDEVVGLPTALAAAGVIGIISSAWAIRDHPVTAMLLTRFYELWRTEGHEPAEALRRAQRWVRGTTNGEKARRFPRYGESFKGNAGSTGHRLWIATTGHSHPYWWAGFTYTGM